MQVKARVITTEADEVQKGIVDLVNKHGIKTLVIGAIPEYVFILFFVQTLSTC